MTEERRIQLVAEVDTTGTRTGFNEIAREAGTMAQSVARASGQADAAVEGIGTSATASARNVEAAERNIANAIQRRIATMRAGASGTAAFYEATAQLRGVDTTRLQPLLTQLRELESVQTRANTAVAGASAPLHQVGVSAAQTAAALRGVPAQFTDIVTSLQGGQAPLTVLFQQGGQLRDMFGSAGGAARALGGYVMGLVTPYTVAAAAAVVLGVAYHQGSEEAKAYRQQLLLSGNAAGTTAGQLSDMAREISATVGTQGSAAEALAAMVGTGKVAAANLEKFSTVAIRAQRSLGQSVEDTAKEFADLARAPLSSLEKLNEKYHFLTGSTYAQVKALLDQGRAVEAGRLAQQTYADAFDDVTRKVDGNLGIMEKGWRGVADIAKAGWDAMLNVGREDSLTEKLAKVRAEIAKAQKPFDASVGGNAEVRARLQNNLALEASLESQIAKEQHVAGIQAEQGRFNAADLEWSKLKTQNLTRAQQLEFDLAQTRQKGLDAGASDVEINTELAKVRLKYNDIYNDGIDSQIAGLKRRQAVEDIIAKRALDQISARRAEGSITEDDAINQSASRELADMAAKRKAMEEELALIKRKQNSQTAQADKQGEIAALDEAAISRRQQLTNDLFALEQRRFRQALENYANVRESASAERDGLVQQVRAQRDYNEQIGMTATELLNLANARLEEKAARKDEEADIAEGLDLSGELAKSYREQAAALRDRASAERDGFAKSRDPWTALSSSVKRYGDEASNAGLQIGDAMTNAFRSAEDAFVGFVTTGKLSFKDFATSVLADLARIEARKAMSSFASFALDGIGSMFGPGTIGGGVGGARANGGPVSGGVPYLVGERGPEIIVPSSSGTVIPNHALGSGGGVQINLNTSVSAGNASTQGSGDSGTARAMADALNAKIRDVVARETRQGGLIWNYQNGRA
jgi:lambda family phage tail tape measure protein